ncbi:MAG TPA: FG-GAP-like repeat-containing protein, partial [Gemmataceae bacterium]|nr:FG-GAP-like repeat-containing protein [Gemmataceae bacterium]
SRTTANPASRTPGLNLEALESREVPALAFQFDYSLDTSGFFNDPSKRAVLEQAAAQLGRQITTTLPALTAGSGSTWSASFYNPANGQYTSVSNPSIPADTLRIYVGARAVSGGEAGFGGTGGYSASGAQSFLDVLKSRWSGGLTMWGGSVAFDSTENWFVGSSAAGIAAGQTDFYSVAVHELGHVLGIGTSQNWSSKVSNGYFVGSSSQAVHGGPVRVSADGAHWAAGVQSDGRVAALAPYLTTGTRSAPFTRLDYAALKDIGWSVSGSAPVGSLPPAGAPVSPPVVPPTPPTPTPAPVGSPSAAPTPSNTGGVRLVLSGLSDGTTQGYQSSSGQLSAVGSRTTPFPGFTGTVRTVVADFNGDKVADAAFGTGSGTTARVRVINGANGTDLVPATTVLDGFAGGVFLAAGDVDRDGKAELAISADAGGGTRVSVFRVRGNTLTTAADFLAYGDANFRGGSRVAMGDVNKDGAADVIVGAGVGGAPRVAVYDGSSVLNGTRRPLVPDFFALDSNLRSGVFVTAADFDSDGYADVGYSLGTTGGPRVRVVSGAVLSANPGRDAFTLPAMADFFAFDANDRSGIRLATRDMNQDGKSELIVATGSQTGGVVRVLTLADLKAPGNMTASYQQPFGNPATIDGIYVG